jgi:hypothetical protein
VERKSQLDAQRKLMEQKEQDLNLMLRDLIFQWEQALNKVKEISELELLKKQREIEKLH